MGDVSMMYQVFILNILQKIRFVLNITTIKIIRMKNLLLFTCMCLGYQAYSQVGINTQTPLATLDVTGKPATTSAIDGMIAPRLSGDQLIGKDSVYTPAQTGSIIYITAMPTVPLTSKTANISKTGYYYFNGTQWMAFENTIIGDIKSSFLTADHNGWVRLDGRSISTLTTSQQSKASSLGFSTNLPNATNSYLVQNGSSLGSISSSNTKTISQNQLPNVQLGGTTNSVSPDIHYDIRNGTSPNQAQIANGPSTSFLAALNSSGTLQDNNVSPTELWQDTHNHTITTNSMNGGVTQQPIDIRPQSMSVNMFVFLGL